MKELLYTFWSNIQIIVGVILIAYYLPYLIKRGWDSGKQDATIKVKFCDHCFRDINKINEKLKDLDN